LSCFNILGRRQITVIIFRERLHCVIESQPKFPVDYAGDALDLDAADVEFTEVFGAKSTQD